MDTIELSKFTTYLRTTRKELFNKLDSQEWEDLYEILSEEFVSKNEIERLEEIYTDKGYDIGFEDARWEYEHQIEDSHDEGYQEGYAEGYADAKAEYQQD